MLPEESDQMWPVSLELIRKGQAEKENLFALLKLKTEQFSAWVTFLCMNSDAHNNLVYRNSFFVGLDVA